MYVVFESHATTTDNEEGKASGWNDVELSKAGMQQAKELGKRRKLKDFDVVFVSDLKRSFDTAILAFGKNTRKIHQDWRLRECDYGDMMGGSKAAMDKDRLKRITEPYPNGESFEVANRRMVNFLKELAQNKDYKNVMIIGHRATHYGLETFIAGKSLDQCIRESLTWKWQPGWKYELK